ncbi:MAG: ubiquinol-cytochrome c reductase iron-sulfur subunit, partial [Acidimicrobiales bacterium]
SGVPAGAPPRLGVAAQGGGPSRRDFLTGGTAAAIVAAVGLVAAALSAGLGRLGGGARGPGVPVSSGKAPAPPPIGGPIANVAAVGVGQAVPFTDPGTDDPAFVTQPQPGKFVAFDAVCPHARCYVHYQAGSRQFVCPCHGSRFDGATGAVLQGPAVTGLAPIPLKVTGGGSIYVA